MLTPERIEKLANRKNVKKIAVENFLSSLGGSNLFDALSNLKMDSKMYKWNAATVNAIQTGIMENFK